MSTLRQRQANRLNAQKSTGPTSVTGKAASSMNACKTGIHAKSLILPTEKLADLEALIDEYHSHHQPASPEARLFVDELIHAEWMLRRLRAAETQAWRYQTDDKYCDPPKYPLGQSATCHATTFAKLQYRMDSTRRAAHRALDALAKLKVEPAPAPTPAPPTPDPLEPPALTRSPQATSPQIGFVPPIPFPAPSQPATPAPNPPEPIATRYRPIA